MKIKERIAKRFLERMKLGKVVFEPDGNIPPDFTFTSTGIGIEVRRLNQALTVQVFGDLDWNAYDQQAERLVVLGTK